MFGEILVRPGLDRAPKSGEAFYCEDWQCPARGECAHHFGRSYAYVAMILWCEPIDGPACKRDKTPYYTPERAPFSPQCRHYERDRPREWLKGDCEPPLMHGEQRLWCCTGCERPECPRASNVVALFPARGIAQ
jgi:hypothetical protein